MDRTLIIDTRQQAGKHNRKDADFGRMGVCTVRSKLPAGDYAYAPRIAVDTKRDLYELNACLTVDHGRFARECDAVPGSTLVILVENREGIACVADLAAWVETDDALAARIAKSGGKVRKRLVGSTMAKACETMHADHGTLFAFCRPEESAKRIIEILEWGEAIGDGDGDGAVGPGDGGA